MFKHHSNWRVVVSEEGQFSIWPLARELPSGWQALEKEGTKEDCLQYIKEEWNDMRPRTLQQYIEATQYLESSVLDKFL